MQLELLAKSTKETENFGYDLAKKLDTGGIARAFIALRGEMGVGKTAFVRGFASYFGISGVRSPTYTIVNEYSAKAHIYHFDMYRLEDEDGLFSIGYEDYIKNDGFVLCEWSENIADFIPNDAVYITLKRVNNSEDARLIEANVPEEMGGILK